MNYLKRRFSMRSVVGRSVVVLLVVLAGGQSPAHAQSPLGPAESEGAVTLEKTGGFLVANFKGKNDQGKPVFQLGYAQRDDSKIAGLRADQRKRHSENPEDPALSRPIRGVNLYGLELVATPSGNTASLFASDRLSVGSRITLSLSRSFVMSSLPSFAEVYEFHLGENLAQIEEDVQTKGDNILRTHLVRLETRMIPTLERLAASSERGPRNDPFIREQLEKARRLRTDIQNRLVTPQDLPMVSAAPAAPARQTAPASSLGGVSADSNQASATSAGRAQGRRMRVLSAPIYDALRFQASFGASRYSLYDPLKPFAEQFSAQDFRGSSFQAGYQANFGGRVPFIVGVNGGWGKENNADELTEVEATDQRTITSPDGTTQRSTTSKRKGLRGIYEETWTQTFRGDIILYPDLLNASAEAANPRSTIALDLFARASRGSATVWGGGAYITQPGNPLKVYGGVNVYRDRDSKLAIDLVAGFPF